MDQSSPFQLWYSEDTFTLGLVISVSPIVVGFINLLTVHGEEKERQAARDLTICCIPLVIWVSLRVMYLMMI